jgi:hypothetical protein
MLRRQIGAGALWLPFFAIVAALVFAAGCGGGDVSGAGWFAGILPDSAVVQAGGTQELRAHSNRDIISVDWVVREGAAGGTVDPFTVGDDFFATYTAPLAVGTYHVDATLTFSDTIGGSNTQVVTSTITVQ